MDQVIPLEREIGPTRVRGFVHQPGEATGEGLVLAHGAGSDARAPLLMAVAEAFAKAGVTVLRIDLPFRQSGRKGPPLPAVAGRDRAGLRAALETLAELVRGPMYLGGHSYGSRQSTMLLAEDAAVPAAALLLLSYPLHPPAKPEQLRTAHLPQLRTPALFVHGTKDPFGTIEEMRAALALIPVNAALLTVDGAGHDLGHGRKHADLWISLPTQLRAIASEPRRP